MKRPIAERWRLTHRSPLSLGFSKAATLAVLAVAGLVAAACGGSSEVEPIVSINFDNIRQLVSPGEIEDLVGRGALDQDVVDFRVLAANVDPQQAVGVVSWLGIVFSQRADGGQITVAVIEYANAADAAARYDEVRFESGMGESRDSIGERSASLAVDGAGLGSVVIFLKSNKAVLLTTATALTDPVPLVDIDGLREIARIAAARLR